MKTIREWQLIIDFSEAIWENLSELMLTVQNIEKLSIYIFNTVAAVAQPFGLYV